MTHLPAELLGELGNLMHVEVAGLVEVDLAED
jgi:hypothetical protein